MTEEDDAAARIAELEADNQRLRRLLDQRDAPGELRHRLRSTLAMLRTIIRKTAESTSDLDAYVAHIEDRVDALARAQAAIDTHGAVQLDTILADELLHYGASDGEQALLSGPIVQFKPRAAQVFALVVHELAVNAIEHGALIDPHGRVEARWKVETGEADPILTFVWQETGAKGVSEPSRRGFGMEVLTSMVRYELRAETSLAFEPDGLCCTIRFLLPPPIGEVIGTSSN